MTEHTKGKWGVYLKSPAPLVIILNESNGLPKQVIATIRLNNGTEDWGEAQANAEFIVKACNNHDKLVGLFEKCFGKLADEQGGNWSNDMHEMWKEKEALQ